MSTKTAYPMLWMLGICPDDRRVIQKAVGERYASRILDDLSPSGLASILEQADGDEPLLLWLDSRSRQRLMEDPHLAAILEHFPTALVLEPDPSREALVAALDAHVQQVLRSPLDEAQVFDVLSRARETQNIYHDMARMSREIMMGRELLERKTDVCAFLFHFFGSVGVAGDARTLLRDCEQAMRNFFAMDGIHAVWWGDSNQMGYLLSLEQESTHTETWRDFLREQALRLLPDGVDGGMLCAGGMANTPEHGKVLMLPLHVRERTCGLMALQLKEERLPTRDMAMALDVVRRHLALTLWERTGRREFFRAPEVAAHTG